jgi:hypothetical protein
LSIRAIIIVNKPLYYERIVATHEERTGLVVARFDETPDYVSDDSGRRRRRMLYALLGVGIAVLVIGLVFLLTR